MVEMVYREKLLNNERHKKIEYKIDNILDLIGHSDKDIKLNQFFETSLQAYCKDPLASVKFSIVNDDKH